MRRLDPKENFQSKILGEPNSGCFLWMGGCDKKGYGRFRTRGDEERLAHRFAWRFSYGEIPLGKQVLHKCDTPACVRPDHLFLGTNDDNMADKLRKGRQTRGERHPFAKFTDDDVLAIRSYVGPNKPLARAFGVDPATTRKIRNGTYWRSI